MRSDLRAAGRKPVKFEDTPFPLDKRFGKPVYRRVHTFPVSKRTLDAVVDKYKQTHNMKIIPVINLVGNKEYMIYIRENKKKKPVKKLVHKFQAKFKSTIHREGRESIRGRN